MVRLRDTQQHPTARARVKVIPPVGSPNVLLTGEPCSGKSTVGNLAGFVDLDIAHLYHLDHRGGGSTQYIDTGMVTDAMCEGGALFAGTAQNIWEVVHLPWDLVICLVVSERLLRTRRKRLSYPELQEPHTLVEHLRHSAEVSDLPLLLLPADGRTPQYLSRRIRSEVSKYGGHEYA